MVRNPQLTELMELQKTQQLTLHLDIENRKDASSPHFAIQNFGLALHNQAPKEHVKMPGAHGAYPKLSGGLCELCIQKPGQFITTSGTQHVQVDKSCWELCWKKDAQAGSLIMGFDIAEDYERNGIQIPRGTVYVNFPVWSKEGLQVARDAKTRAIQRAKEALEERDDELAKYQATSNPLMKVWHYRNAYAAVEIYTLQPLKHYDDWVPEEDEVIPLPGDLFLNKNGFVWTKELPRGKEATLGTAKLVPPADK